MEEVFRELPVGIREYMQALFRNCTEEVRYYMTLVEIDSDTTFITAGEKCTHIYIIISGKVTGIEWPMREKAYPFKDSGPGDFFGEIECFAGMERYRISIETSTKCKVLSIPAVYYMKWMAMDVEALFMRTQTNMKRLLTQTAEARKYLFMDAKDRLMVHLIRKYEQRKHLKALELKQTRSQIAEEIGFSVKTLDRSIRKLEQMGLIEVKKGKVWIPETGYREMKEYIDFYISGETKKPEESKDRRNQTCM